MILVFRVVFATKYRRQVIYGKLKANAKSNACPDHIHIKELLDRGKSSKCLFENPQYKNDFQINQQLYRE